ncbi:PulJ/GspJ family protein [Rubritalea marina]|uniref:PulJ/GspJ family protein n=1 Tax=Rubritalea marina TaxID=361055 RepID=UPI0003A7073F|nr:prepilin-type N-terminal cleavage/methylation domain-containing protein [Rubritalea marina]
MMKNQKLRKGFTLVEVMTAMTITTVIIAVLVGMTRISMDSWKESRDKTRAGRLAKESLELMAHDLESMIIRSGNTYEWMYAKMDGSGELGPSQNAEIKNPLEFSFFTAATDRYDGQIGTNQDKGGDVSLVTYRLAYRDQLDPAGKSFPVYSLYRNLVNPDETFDTYLAQSSIQSLVNGADVVNDTNNFLAENIYNLTVTFIFEYTLNGNLTQKRIPVMQSGSQFNEVSVRGDSIEPQILPDDARLTSIELGALVVSDSAMQVFNNKRFKDNEAFAAALKENSSYFTKSVALPRP